MSIYEYFVFTSICVVCQPGTSGAGRDERGPGGHLRGEGEPQGGMWYCGDGVRLVSEG